MLAASAVARFDILDEGCNGLVEADREFRYAYINSPAPIGTWDHPRQGRVYSIPETST